MENCKNCFFAASCAATADPKITDEERKLVDTALIAQYSDENRRLKKAMANIILWLCSNPRCEHCKNQLSVSCECCGVNYDNYVCRFAGEFNEIMARE